MKQETIKPWERQPKESIKAYEAFCRYRDMGYGRTLKKVAVELGKSQQNMNMLSMKWDWVKRTQAWIDELEKIKAQAQKKEIEDMVKRHCQESMLFQKVLTLPAEALIKELKKDPESFSKIPIPALFEKALKSANVLSSIIDIERKSRGEPDSIRQTDVTSGGKEIVVIKPVFEEKK